MNIEDLKALGTTTEELQQKIVDQAVHQLLYSTTADDEGDPVQVSSEFYDAINKAIAKRIDEAVSAMAEKRVLPNVTAYIENLCLQETNKWGEKTGKPTTFVEYLVSRAENYMTEDVDFSGKAKRESDSYSWSKKTTRIAYLIHHHLQCTIENAMKKALADANTTFVKGLEGACKSALELATANFKVKTTID